MNIAIIENGIVVNTIVCESVELAESITGLTAVEYTDEKPAGINWTYNSTTKKFKSPQPFPSWIYNEEIKQWEAPVEYPTDDKRYIWDEQTLSWVEVAP
jgi:hypothetical protein